MSVFAFLRGHEITTVGSTVSRCDWRYSDSGGPVVGNERHCTRCGKLPIDVPGLDTGCGADACLGVLPGVKAACCGHGVGHPYVYFEDGSGIGYEDALAWQELMKRRNGQEPPA